MFLGFSLKRGDGQLKLRGGVSVAVLLFLSASFNAPSLAASRPATAAPAATTGEVKTGWTLGGTFNTAVEDVAWSPSGDLTVATATGNVWQLEQGSWVKLGTLAVPASNITWSPTGLLTVLSGNGVFQDESGRFVTVGGTSFASAVVAIAWSPLGSPTIETADGNLYSLSGNAWSWLGSGGGLTNSLSYSPGGLLTVANGYDVEQLQNGNLVSLDDSSFYGYFGSVTWSPQGVLTAWGGSDGGYGSVGLYQDGVWSYPGNAGQPFQSPILNGSYVGSDILAITQDQNAWIYSPTTSNWVLSHTFFSMPIAFSTSSQGEVAVETAGNNVWLFANDAWTEAGTFPTGFSGDSTLAWSTSGTLAVGTDAGRVWLMSASASPSPVISSINPSTGPDSGGTTVTISGTGFSGTTSVLFGGTDAASFQVVSSTEIIAVTPTGSGNVEVTVETPNGSGSSGGQDEFTYEAGSTSASQAATMTVSPSGTQTVSPGNALTFTFVVDDSQGNPVANSTVDFATTGSLNPADLSAASGVTSSQGTVTVTYTDPNSGDTGTIVASVPGSTVSVSTGAITVGGTSGSLPILTVTINGVDTQLGLPPGLPVNQPLTISLPSTVDGSTILLPPVVFYVTSSGQAVLGTPPTEVVVPLPSGTPSGTPTSLLADFDQNGTLIATAELPASDLANGTITFEAPASLSPGTYQVSVILEYSNGTFVDAGPVSYTAS